LLKPFTEALRQIEVFPVSNQANHIFRAVKDCRTVGTRFEMRFHTGTQTRIEITIDVIGDLSPDVNATDLNDCH
jgi:hypothetical protein